MNKRKQLSCLIFKRVTFFVLLIFLSPSIASNEKNELIINQEKNQEKFQLANQLLHRGEFKKAARSYIYLVENSKGTVQKDSLEMLGVAYEEAKRLAQAKATYEKYINKYKSGESTDRVKQRLVHLIESELEAKVPRIYTVKNRRPSITSRHKAYFMQTLSFSQNNFNEGHYDTDQLYLYSFLNSDWRKRSNGQEFNTRVTARYANNFENKEHGPLDFKNAFFSYKNSKHGVKLKLGRQQGYAFGVSGRFDGVSSGVKIYSGLSGAIALGSPVSYFERDSINKNESFYAANINYISANDKMAVESYLINHQFQGYTNRRAIGSSIRWQENATKLFAATDIDLFYETYNLIQAQAEFEYNKYKFFFHFDSRRNPFLEAGTALLSITDLHDMDELHALYTNEQIKQLALDLTGGAISYRAGLQRSLNKHLSLSGDVVLAEYLFNYIDSSNQIQGNREQTTSLKLRLVAQHYTQLKEISIFNLKLIDSSRYDRLVFQVSNRILPLKKLQLRTKLRVSFRDSDSGERQNIAYPAISLKSKFGKKSEVNMELGRSWYWFTGNSNNRDYQRNYINAGFIMRF